MPTSIPDPDPKISTGRSDPETQGYSVFLDPTVLLLALVVLGSIVAALTGLTAPPAP